MEDRPKFAFVGNSHMAFWALNIYFPQREYVERYVKAVLAIPSLKTYLFCIFPRNDYDDYSTAVNKFIRMLNQKIHARLEGTEIVCLDVFDRLLQDGRLNPGLTIDDLHLNGKGYSILSDALKKAVNG